MDKSVSYLASWIVVFSVENRNSGNCFGREKTVLRNKVGLG